MHSSRSSYVRCTTLAVLLSACQTATPSSTTTTTTSTTVAASTTTTMPASSEPAVQASSMIAAGEYLTIVGSCNDCHTQGWSENEGRVAPEDRMAGNTVGYRGSWGTSYGKNLRTVVQRQSEDHWVEVLKTADGGEGKPPMPWWNTKLMSERDVRAMYRYVKSLGPKANGIPRSLPPGRVPTGPYIWVTPRTGP